MTPSERAMLLRVWREAYVSDAELSDAELVIVHRLAVAGYLAAEYVPETREAVFRHTCLRRAA